MIPPVFSYFEPGSGSLLLQLLLGGTAGLLVAGRYFWNSIRGKNPKPAERQEAARDSSGEIPVEG